MKGFKGKRPNGKQLKTKTSKALQSSNRPVDRVNELSARMLDWSRQHIWTGQRRWLTLAASGIILAGGLGFVGNQYVAANTVPYYKVYVKGQEVGAIQNEDQLAALYENKSQAYAEKYPDAEMVLNTEAITTKIEKAYKADVDSKATLTKLDGMLTAYAKGVKVMVDGQEVGIVKDEDTAKAAIKALQKEYIPEGQGQPAGWTSSVKKTSASSASNTSKAWLMSVGVNEDISYEEVKADPNKLLSEEGALQALKESKEQPITYTVREGDNLSSIASQFGMTAWEVKQNNPGTREKYLQIGDTLQVTAPKAPVTVTTVEKIVEQVTIEPTIVTRESDELKAGTSKVVRPGQSGLKQMDFQITKENGQVIKEEWLGQKVIKESVPEVVLKGTKVVGEGTGQFTWPVSGAILTSSYGGRWGRMHEGIDMGGNRDIKASDEGVVTFAGQQNGYGNVIIIDHGNGYQTLYGHLSSIGVRSGQVVRQGESIGVMGNTGRSTGTHLHFEIRKNNVPQNPMTYLR
ncbi:Murein hydrolase activator NlpD precursor [compost metagenome]